MRRTPTLLATVLAAAVLLSACVPTTAPTLTGAPETVQPQRATPEPRVVDEPVVPGPAIAAEPEVQVITTAPQDDLPPPDPPMLAQQRGRERERDLGGGDRLGHLDLRRLRRGDVRDREHGRQRDLDLDLRVDDRAREHDL